MVNTLNHSIYLTFDVDWADDTLIEKTASLLATSGVRGTFFATHDSPCLRELARDRRYEIGIHPNYNPLLTGQDPRPAETTIQKLLEVYPDAVSVRSHSLTSGTTILNTCYRLGLRLDSNLYIPADAAGPAKSWVFWNGMTIVPFVWSDYIDVVKCRRDSLPRLSRGTHPMTVVSFHPVHIHVNTSCETDYHKYKEDRDYRSTSSGGVGDQFRDFLAAIKKMELQSARLCDLL